MNLDFNTSQYLNNIHLLKTTRFKYTFFYNFTIKKAINWVNQYKIILVQLIKSTCNFNHATKITYVTNIQLKNKNK